MQKRTSPSKFGHLAEYSGFNSVPNLSTKASAAYAGADGGAAAGGGTFARRLLL